jgi:hypothetical protein
LVTLDKAGHATDFQYQDHFVSPTEFEWQSQNRTAQASTDGADIQKHAERGIVVHLFVRAEKKRVGGGAAPFTYCGDVRYVAWHGERPITSGGGCLSRFQNDYGRISQCRLRLEHDRHS